MSKPPIVWHSNAPWAPTGYGNQTKVFTPLIRNLGYDVAISAYFGLNGRGATHEGMAVYPGVGDAYGAEILTPHLLHHVKNPTKGFNRKPGKALKDGLVITLMDVWVLPGGLFDQCVGGCWVPVDHDPVPPAVVSFFERAQSMTPIAMSRFGQEQLQRALPGRLVEYVPHGIDTDTYYPYEDEEREDTRERLGIEGDRFVVGVVAANQGNPSRKSYPEMLEAFAKFIKTDAGRNALLYLHTDRDGRNHGVALQPLMETLGLTADNVRMVPQYEYLTGMLNDDYMRDAYNACDVLLNPAMGEGFGIPIIEAQACGTPVIVTANTAMVEVGKVGAHVSGQRVYTPQRSWQIVPSVDQLVDALTTMRSMAPRKRGAARLHAMDYDAHSVLETHWEPVLERLAARVGNSRGYLVEA